MPPIAILVALADPTRCRLVELLRAGPQPVHVLAAAFKISRPAISRHLRVLKQSGLISEKKFGRENRYALHVNRLAPVQRWLSELVPSPKTGKDAAKLKTSSSRPVAIASPAPGILMVAADPVAPVPAKPVKPTKPAKPAVSQMGFDF